MRFFAVADNSWVSFRPSKQYIKENYWYTWFAWRPVYCTETQGFVWLEKVWACFYWKQDTFYKAGHKYVPRPKKVWKYKVKALF